MPTIRRLYLYAVALVSVEVVLWGAIGLARSFFAGAVVGGSVSRLAGALALILVGVPVFLIHWLLAQRLARRDPEERSARLRAVFLYGALLVLLIPAAQNALALFDRLFLDAFGQPPFRMLFGAGQSLGDNLVAILLSLAVAAYFYTVLLSDWRAVPQGDAFPEVRRLYRYVWLLYGLLLVFFGVQQVLQFSLTSLGELGAAKPTLALTPAMLAHGLALLLVGVPIWVFVWLRIQGSLDDPAESASLLRLAALYLLAFASLCAGLVAAGLTMYSLLRLALGEPYTLNRFIGEIAAPLSVLIPSAMVWAYYGHFLNREMRFHPDESRRGESARRSRSCAASMPTSWLASGWRLSSSGCTFCSASSSTCCSILELCGAFCCARTWRLPLLPWSPACRSGCSPGSPCSRSLPSRARLATGRAARWCARSTSSWRSSPACWG